VWGPIGWAWDKVTGFVGDVATAGFEAIVGGLVAWVVDAVVWVVGGVFNYFIDATDPNVQADWFITGDGPYATSAAIGAMLMVGFLLAGVTQGVVTGDVGGMLRRIALDLPLSVLGMVGLVTFTQALVRLTDELSTWVLAGFQDDIADFTAVVGSLSRLGGVVATALVVFVLGLITVLAGIALVGELAVRAALVYVVVALAPLVFAAQLWPALKGTAQKLLKILCALILSKLVIAIALAVAAAAAVGAGSGGEVTALPEPEVMAEDPGGSVTQAVGILLSAAVAFAVAALSPLLVTRLLPLAEEAAVAQGIRGGPVRAGQQALSTAYSIQMFRHYRLRGLASGPPSAGGSDDDGPGGGGGGGSAGPGGRGRRRTPGGGSGSSGSGARTSRAPTGGRTTAGGGTAGGGGSAAGSSGASGAAAAAGPAGAAAAAAAKVKDATSRTTKRGARAAQAKATAATDNASGAPPAAGSGDGARTQRRRAAGTSGERDRPGSPPKPGRSSPPRRRPKGGPSDGE
jgi:type IV secretion system protein TrbL